MDMTPDILAVLALVAVSAGFIDSIAGGGGLLTIPALMAVGIPPVQAIATNKFQGTFGTGGAFLAYARKGHIDFAQYLPHAIVAAVGSAFGAWALQIIDPYFLAGLVPVLLIAMMIYYLAAPGVDNRDRRRSASLPLLFAATAIIGFYDGFFGPGTGSFFTTMLILLGGLGLLRAIAHTKLLNFSTNLSALVLMIASGKIIWSAAVVMAIGSICGNQIGAHTAMRFNGRGVRPILILVSAALTWKLLADPANPLRLWIGI